MELYERVQQVWDQVHEVSDRILALEPHLSLFDQDDQQTISRVGASCLAFSKTLLVLDAQGANEQESRAFVAIVEDFCVASKTMLAFAERTVQIQQQTERRARESQAA